MTSDDCDDYGFWQEFGCRGMTRDDLGRLVMTAMTRDYRHDQGCEGMTMITRNDQA